MSRLGQPLRACLDIPGDVEGGRIVAVSEWLYAQQPHLPQALIDDAMDAMICFQTYRAPNGAWSLTPV